jgi:SPP1 family predicted phage head-tail adaptor
VKCCEITAGDIRYLAELQGQVNTPIPGAGNRRSYVKKDDIRIGFKALSGYERNNADRLDAQTKNRITMRYREDITESDRILFRGKAYNIRFIDNVEMRNRWLVIDVDGGVAT